MPSRDAGCGHGAESSWLAAHGWEVTAVFRQRKRRRKAPKEEAGAAIVGDPADPFELALRGLTNMGFREHEARRALDVIHHRIEEMGAPPPAPAQLICEVLTILC